MKNEHRKLYAFNIIIIITIVRQPLAIGLSINLLLPSLIKSHKNAFFH